MAGHFINVYWKRIFISMSNKFQPRMCFYKNAYVLAHFMKSNFFFHRNKTYFVDWESNKWLSFRNEKYIKKVKYNRLSIVICACFSGISIACYSIQNFIQAHKFHHLWMVFGILTCANVNIWKGSWKSRKKCTPIDSSNCW